eukprot:TRINITY_DN286_c0_g1_i4.p1 TRINITY_DN286_c0_g1~~TRINITY_DN286_c0_g1_i4.p1  ORF type:complete len:149 (-),score=67.72 TRINITY_DN286_c0_g1_i4:190-636(-)
MFLFYGFFFSCLLRASPFFFFFFFFFFFTYGRDSHFFCFCFFSPCFGCFGNALICLALVCCLFCNYVVDALFFPVWGELGVLFFSCFFFFFFFFFFLPHFVLFFALRTTAPLRESPPEKEPKRIRTFTFSEPCEPVITSCNRTIYLRC